MVLKRRWNITKDTMMRREPAHRAADVGASFRYAPLVSHIGLTIFFAFYELYLSKKLDRFKELGGENRDGSDGRRQLGVRS